MAIVNPLVGGGIPAAVANNDNGRPSGAVLDDARDTVVIDGTPVRVVVLSLAAALSVAALRWAGFKFNVGVSS